MEKLKVRPLSISHLNLALSVKQNQLISTNLRVLSFESGAFKVNEDCLRLGISPLHQWPRSLEAVLHLAYKKDIKRWRKNKKLGDDAVIEQRKRLIQDQCQ